MKFYVMTAPPLEITKRIFNTRIEAYFYIRDKIKECKTPIEWDKIEDSILMTEIDENKLPEYVNIFHDGKTLSKELCETSA